MGQRVSTFRESSECIIRVEPCVSPKIVRLMLEFLYTNRIESLKSSSRSSSAGGVDTSPATITTDELLSLLHLSDMWQLRDLKRLVEHELIRSHTTIDTVARMYCATKDFGVVVLPNPVSNSSWKITAKSRDRYRSRKR